MDDGKPKILIAEDDDVLLGVLCHNFERDGYQCLTATDGSAAVNVAQMEKLDLIILDIMLPKIDGFEVCRILRRNMTTPIIMLTAKIDETDKIVGLELGADDYIAKPFSMRELKARVKSNLRRSRMPHSQQTVEEPPGTAITSQNLTIDTARYQATVDGVPLNLTPKEFNLLGFLVHNKGLVLSRGHILDKVWGYNYSGDTRTVDFHVLGLRKKIEADARNPKRLVTVWGVGYKFVG